MTSVLDISPQNLGQLDAQRSVEIFRDLLWGHARKQQIPITKVHITQNITIGDGGIDAAIDEDIPLTDDPLLVEPGTCYQIKAGTSFKPWQPSQLSKELFGKSNADKNIQNLNEGIKHCLSNSRRYIIVCFGIDPTSEQIRDGKRILKSYLTQCGFPESNVEIWGQTHLVGLLSEYPSLCLKILGRSEYHFQTIESWSQNADMQPLIELGSTQVEFIKTIQGEIRADNYHHLRVIGEPGIGKTRLVLEALQENDLAPNVIYIPHAEDFQRSQLFNELLKTDTDLFVILVIDECPEKERASLWNLLKPRAPKCQLITIDHGPDNSADDRTRILHCPILGEEQIAAIINGYIPSQDATHWARWCDGSPRVAHAVGQNLRSNPEDILKPPAIVPIWKRYVAGYENPDSEKNKQKLVGLRHIALFQKFGFESPVVDEAQFIAGLVRSVDSNITWGHFQSIVAELKQRRILQGKTTLFLVPKALHVYLWLDYWQNYGRGFSFEKFIGSVPQTLRGWFMQMFIYAHANPLAQQVVTDILKPGGPYDDEVFLASEQGGKFLSVLAEADPKSTLRCIDRNFGTWSKDKLRTWTTGRQHVVWALEKIAIWTDSFAGAAKMLLHLGSAENSNVSNNASGTFAGLFSLSYGRVAPTIAPPSRRLSVFQEAVESDDPDKQSLGLKACETALSVAGGFRSLGPEYQGLRPVAELWMPKTYGEIFDAYKAVWNLLLNTSREWPNEHRKRANDVLIQASFGLWRISSLENLVLDTLDILASDEATNKASLVRLIVRTRRFAVDGLSQEILDRLTILDQFITGDSLESQIERYVLLTNWDEEYDRKGKKDEFLDSRVDDLGAQLVSAKPEVFQPVIDRLVRVEGHKLYQFGSALARYDAKKILLSEIIETQKKAGINGKTQLIGGYLNELRVSNEGDWEKTVSAILSNDDFKNVAGELVWRTGVNEKILSRMLERFEQDDLQARHFLILRYPQQIRTLTTENIETVIQVLLAKSNLEAIHTALELAHSCQCHKDSDVHLSEDLVFQVLVDVIMCGAELDTMENFYWEILAKSFLIQYPARDLEIFEIILSNLNNWKLMILKRMNSFHIILEQVAKNRPKPSWQIVSSMLSDLDSPLAHGILRWLKAEDSFGEEPEICPLTYFPVGLVLAWIEEDPETRAPIMARAVPKTLDKSNDGELTRELLHRYGHMERVRSTLMSSFYAEGWTGPTSLHYRKKRDLARSWLDGENSPNLIGWIEKYIDSLTEQIKSEELQEEREY